MEMATSIPGPTAEHAACDVIRAASAGINTTAMEMATSIPSPAAQRKACDDLELTTSIWLQRS